MESLKLLRAAMESLKLFPHKVQFLKAAMELLKLLRSVI